MESACLGDERRRNDLSKRGGSVWDGEIAPRDTALPRSSQLATLARCPPRLDVPSFSPCCAVPGSQLLITACVLPGFQQPRPPSAVPRHPHQHPPSPSPRMANCPCSASWDVLVPPCPALAIMPLPSHCIHRSHRIAFASRPGIATLRSRCLPRPFPFPCASAAQLGPFVFFLFLFLFFRLIFF